MHHDDTAASKHASKHGKTQIASTASESERQREQEHKPQMQKWGKRDSEYGSMVSPILRA